MQPFSLRRLASDPEFARGAPFLLFVLFLVLGSSVEPEAGGKGQLASWLAVARGGAVALVLAWFWRGYSELRAPRSVAAGYWPVAVLAGVAVFLAWIWLDQDWAVSGRSAGYDPRGPTGEIDYLQALLRLAGLALVVPVMEELFWRSLVLRWIRDHDFLAVDPRRVGAPAFLIVTVLFALEHNQWLAGAIAGIAYNVLYMSSRNLWVPIVAHAVTNAALGLWILATGNWQFW